MYNIEEKIKAWYKNNNLVPVTSNEDEDKKDESENQEDDVINIEILTDEQLKQKALESVKGKYDEKRAEVNEKLAMETQNLTNKANQKINAIESKKQDVVNEYDNLNKKAIDDSVKKGISRSSIVGGQIERNNKNKLSELDVIDTEIDRVKKNNEIDVDYKTKKGQKTIEEIDKEQFKEAEEVFAKLKAEQEKMIEQAIKDEQDRIKLELQQKEKQYQEYLDKYKFTQPEDVDIEFVEGLEEQEQRALRQALLNNSINYYLSFTPKKAKELFEKDEHTKQVLGSYSKILQNYIDMYVKTSK